MLDACVCLLDLLGDFFTAAFELINPVFNWESSSSNLTLVGDIDSTVGELSDDGSCCSITTGRIPNLTTEGFSTLSCSKEYTLLRCKSRASSSFSQFLS